MCELLFTSCLQRQQQRLYKFHNSHAQKLEGNILIIAFLSFSWYNKIGIKWKAIILFLNNTTIYSTLQLEWNQWITFSCMQSFTHKNANTIKKQKIVLKFLFFCALNKCLILNETQTATIWKQNVENAHYQ